MEMYKIHIVDEENELLDTIEIYPGKENWDSNATISLLGKDIIGEIKAGIKMKGGETYVP